MSSRPKKRRFINQTRTSQTRTSQTRTSQTRTSESDPPVPDPPGQTLEDDFLKATSSFIRVFENRGGRMKKISGELRTIAEEVKEVQIQRIVGVICGVVACALGAAAAPFSGWVTVAIAAGGGTAIANAYKNGKQGVKENLKRVEALRREFLLNMEPLEEELEEVKASAQKLEVLAGSSPSESEVFKKIRSRASQVLAVMAAVMLLLRDTEFQKTKEPLDKTIVQEAAQLDTVMAELEKIKRELHVFRDTPIKTAIRLYIQQQASGGGASTPRPRPRHFPQRDLAGGSQRRIAPGKARKAYNPTAYNSVAYNSMAYNSMAYSSVAYNSRPMISSHNVAGLIT